jgi:hypothetical protein
MPCRQLVQAKSPTQCRINKRAYSEFSLSRDILGSLSLVGVLDGVRHRKSTAVERLNGARVTEVEPTIVSYTNCMYTHVAPLSTKH